MDEGELHRQRDRHIQLVLNAFERGLLGAADYEYRLSLLEQAATVEEMRQIVLDMPLGGRSPQALTGPPAASGPHQRSEVGWDAVDAALAAARTPPRPAGRARRVTALVFVVVVFVVLLILGVVLAASTHPQPSGARHRPGVAHLAPAPAGPARRV